MKDVWYGAGIYINRAIIPHAYFRIKEEAELYRDTCCPTAGIIEQENPEHFENRVRNGLELMASFKLKEHEEKYFRKKLEFIHAKDKTK